MVQYDFQAKPMKAKIHPNYFTDAKISCSCGNTFTTGSTMESIQVEICSACHPFYTGQVKYVDTLGRVERFKQKKIKADAVKAQLIEKRQKQDDRKREQQSPKTLREMLLGM